MDKFDTIEPLGWVSDLSNLMESTLFLKNENQTME